MLQQRSQFQNHVYLEGVPADAAKEYDTTYIRLKASSNISETITIHAIALLVGTDECTGLLFIML